MSDRGSGRTTDAMHSAPPKAIYVWCNDRLDYPKRLALDIGRKDLQIVGPSWLRDGWYGLEYPAIVVDHATHLGDEQIRLLAAATSRCRHARNGE